LTQENDFASVAHQLAATYEKHRDSMPLCLTKEQIKKRSESAKKILCLIKKMILSAKKDPDWIIASSLIAMIKTRGGFSRQVTKMFDSDEEITQEMKDKIKEAFDKNVVKSFAFSSCPTFEPWVNFSNKVKPKET